jgi:hypothetical protein
MQSVGGKSREGLITIHYCLIWEYWVPFPSPLTTRRDYGGSILTLLHTGWPPLSELESESLYGWQSVSQSVSQSVCLGVEPTLWTFDQILLPFQVFGSGICCPVPVGRPFWREAGSVVLSHSLVICLSVHLLFTFLSFTPLPYIYTIQYI